MGSSAGMPGDLNPNPMSLALDGELAMGMRLAPWSAVAERGTSDDTALATQARRTPCVRPPEIPSEGGVALSLPAALQGSARLPACIIRHERETQ